MYLYLRQATSDRMVEQTLRACPSLLTDEAKSKIRAMVLSSPVSSDFTYAKKAVTKKTAPEVVSHVSAINLDVAANISELIVEQTLARLDKANLKLVNHDTNFKWPVFLHWASLNSYDK